MLKIQDRIKFYTDKDYFKIRAIGQGKVRRLNILMFCGAGTLIVIILFYIILYITTNYHKLDNFEEYIHEFNKGSAFSNFDKINVGIKIMPSYNLEKNILYMRHSKDVSIEI